jgi:hypothetical protein
MISNTPANRNFSTNINTASMINSTQSPGGYSRILEKGMDESKGIRLRF